LRKEALATKQSSFAAAQRKLDCFASLAMTLMDWIASRSLSSGAHSRDPLARNDGFKISGPPR
jgi:hypothetical protein